MKSRICCLVFLLTLGGCAGAPTQSKSCEDDRLLSSISTPTVKLMTLNISHGRGTSWNQMFVSGKQIHENLDDIAKLLREVDADIVALQEADAASRWSRKFDHVEYLAGQSEYSCFLHGRHKDSWIAAFGTVLMSNVELENASSLAFARSPPTNTKGLVQSTVNWIIDGHTTPITVVSVHLDFSRKSVRESQVDEMVGQLSGLESPLIIMGDLNSDWSNKRSSVRRLAEALELSVYLPDAPDLGTYKKISGDRLDWILISPSLNFIDYKVVPDIVSDHLAVYAEVALREVKQQ